MYTVIAWFKCRLWNSAGLRVIESAFWDPGPHFAHHCVCTVKILSEYFKTEFLPTHSFPTFSSVQWFPCNQAYLLLKHPRPQPEGQHFLHSFVHLFDQHLPSDPYGQILGIGLIRWHSCLKFTCWWKDYALGWHFIDFLVKNQVFCSNLFYFVK